MLAFLAQSCYNAITGSVWSCSPHCLTISHRPTILACFGAATTRMCGDLSYRKIMNYADEIKQRVSMIEILKYYGIETNGSNFCRCPFHHEKSASFKAYPGTRGFYCFGCHESGSVIDFVMRYFNLDFPKAIIKLNDDFHLGLPIGKKIDRRTQLEMNKAAFERKRKIEAEKKRQEQIENDYWTAFDEWKRLDDNKRNYDPKTPTEPLHPLFVEALKNIAGAEYNLSCAEIARYEYEKRNSHDS